MSSKRCAPRCCAHSAVSVTSRRPRAVAPTDHPLYPILMRLSDRGLLESGWEPDAPLGRPPRHLHRLTAAGLAAATDLPVIVTPRKATTGSAGNRSRASTASS
ncbi:MAG: helix-turn-helix transcriptional regulator [Solirubrobacteraceae bacterium]